MQSFMLGLLASSLIGLASAADDIVGKLQPCANAFYLPEQYTCFYDYKLCPVLNGVAYQPCGEDCYSEAMYSCENGKLAPPQVSKTGSFKVSVVFSASEVYDLQANGLVFRIGGNPATYCPSIVSDCPPSVSETVWICADGLCNLNVEVPGGQQIYIAPNGALSFTIAHSGYVPPGSLFDGFTVDPDGKLYFAGLGFYSCPPSDGTSEFQIYASAHSPDTDRCVVVQLFTSTDIGYGFGAWQYV